VRQAVVVGLLRVQFDVVGGQGLVAGTQPKRWWRYAVVRGEGLPLGLDGKWFDLDDMRTSSLRLHIGTSGRFGPTNQFEVRDDGEPAVVYRLEQG
jgi:hypothetical protein